MVRTKANQGASSSSGGSSGSTARRAVAEKAPRKLSAASNHTARAVGNGPSPSVKETGLNPVCARPTPDWQKPISSFFGNSTKSKVIEDESPRKRGPRKGGKRINLGQQNANSSDAADAGSGDTPCNENRSATGSEPQSTENKENEVVTGAADVARDDNRLAEEGVGESAAVSEPGEAMDTAVDDVGTEMTGGGEKADGEASGVSSSSSVGAAECSGSSKEAVPDAESREVGECSAAAGDDRSPQLDTSPDTHQPASSSGSSKYEPPAQKKRRIIVPSDSEDDD